MSMRRQILPVQPERTRPDVSLAIVNIVLLLILFFLATGALVNTPDQGVDLSETRDLDIDQLPPPVLIVEQDGSLTLDGEPVPATGLAQALNGQSPLHVLVDRTTPAQDLLNLLDNPDLKQLDIQLVTIHRRDSS